MIPKRIFLSLLFILTIANTEAQQLTENSFGKGLVNVVAVDSSYSMNFAARFQTLYSSEWNFPNNEALQDPESAFFIRRARLKFQGFAYTPRLQYKMELGLSNRDISGASAFTNEAPRYILDAVAMWNFYENFVLWAGQAKLPGNRERLISSANMETVDRSLVNSRFTVDRDLGVQLHHFFILGNNFIVREALAVSQGEGRNVVTGNIGGYQYTGRLEIFPLGNFNAYSGADLLRLPTPKLAIGASLDYNDDAVRSRSNMGSYMITDYGFHHTDISTFFLDAMFKYEGWSAMAEYAHRDADEPVALNSDGTPTGAIVNVGDGINLQAGYLFKNNLQLLGRFTSISLDELITGIGIENQYTVGLSKYFVGHKLKVQTDLSLNDFEDNINNELVYRVQFDIHF